MKLLIKKENIIKDITTWFKYAEPEGGESQWEEGRSALEFARYMTSNNGSLPIEIEKYLSSINLKAKEFCCCPEEVTSYKGYDLGSGSGRHHDGLLISKECVVGIEAKVSEPFDKSIKEKLIGASDNMHKRIMNSVKMIKTDYADETLTSVEHIMYQLISGTVGTIIEAKNRDIHNAVFLIIEFTGDVKKEAYYDRKIEANKKSYNEFLVFLGLANKEDKDRFLSFEKGLRLWIKKINITIKKGSYMYELD